LITMRMERLQIGRSAWPTLDDAARLEWLETNGLGGWAFGTVPNAQTRFYHAVLAPALQPPTERLVLLAKLEESLVIDGDCHPLYANYWASGAVHGEVLHRLQSFALSPFPTWTFTVGDCILRKRLFMRHGQNATIVRYSLWRGAGNRPVELRLVPLITCRTIHGVHFANDWPFTQERLAPANVAVEPYVGAPRLHLALDTGEYQPGGEWVRGLHYPYEALRGEQRVEDLYRPGQFIWSCDGSGELTFVASAEPVGTVHGAEWEAAECSRRQELIRISGAADPFAAALVQAADPFIVQRDSTKTQTVIAGYPWFTDWGRDTMISLHGLALSTRRFGLARELLATFAAYERDGLIPNCFPENGQEPLYNTADASLWFFEAAWQYLQHTDDEPFIRHLLPTLKRIAEANHAGTHYAIGAVATGLLHCGRPDVQVTWMDAKVNDWVVTPRNGFPVEIQALWYNALCILAALTQRFESVSAGTGWEVHAKRTQEAFGAFWDPSIGGCYDLLRPDGSYDPAIRPNQLFALSLAFPLLTGERARQVVDLCFTHLWTPYGLRSLSPSDPAYRGHYVGSRLERDGAYHQGTVWTWLIGPFLRAYLHGYGRTPDRIGHVRTLLEPLRAHLLEFGLGSVAENFDGDAPHPPRACVAQAWSVAELLRIWREEISH
jgi:predicted glycogen debranching enzyme